jgi:hypothetical protein
MRTVQRNKMEQSPQNRAHQQADRREPC